MWQVVLACPPHRRQVAEVLGVHEALVERPLGHRQQREEHDAHEHRGRHSCDYEKEHAFVFMRSKTVN